MFTVIGMSNYTPISIPIGLPISLNIASLAKDGMILNAARDCADSVLKADPTLHDDRNQLLRKELRKDKYQIKDYSKIS